MRQRIGTAGNDELFPFPDEDTEILGLEGQDTLFAGGRNDTLDGGAGFDFARFSTFFNGQPIFDSGVTVNLSSGLGSATVDGDVFTYTLRSIEDLWGSNANDVLTGNSESNEIQGLSGNDRIFGLEGFDTLFSGEGDDTVDAGPDNDILFGDSGNNVLDGGTGFDLLRLDTALGNTPVFDAGVSANLATGVMTAIVDAQTFQTQLFNIEDVWGSNADDTLTGSDDANEIQGLGGDDELFGLGGNDTLFAVSGDDTLDGGAGDDELFVGFGNATLIGGDDLDTAAFNATSGGAPIFDAGVTADLALGFASLTSGGSNFDFTLQTIENLSGTDFADNLSGDSGNNLFQGLDGNDMIFGLAGNDTIFAGDGEDTVEGGEDDDEIFVSEGNTTVDGGSGEDWVRFSTFQGGEPELTGGVVANLFDGSATASSDQGSFAYVIQNIENVEGTIAADSLTGDDADNTLRGSDGDDTIKGGAGDDMIIGGAGNDISLYDGMSDHFTVQHNFIDDETYIVDRTGAEGTDSRGTNILRFADRDHTVVRDGQDYFEFGDNDSDLIDPFLELVELYIAYFNRAPDAEGLYFWALAVVNGTTLDQAADFFFDQPETRALYGETLDLPVFVDAVYNNVLGRSPDNAGETFWVNQLDAGNVTEGQFIRSFLQGARAEPPMDADADFIAQQNADRAFLDAKTAIGVNFGAVLGMSDVANANSVMALFDGTDDGLTAARAATDEAFQDALATDGSGEFLIQLVGFVDDPFEGISL